MVVIVVNMMTNTNTAANDTTNAAEVAITDRKGRTPDDKGHRAEVIKGVSIRLFGTDTSYNLHAKGMVEKAYSRTFAIGDKAEYDSYNLSYIGTIVQITEKTVTIREHGCSCDRIHRLSMYDFEWRNWNFDLAKEEARNADTLDHI